MLRPLNEERESAQICTFYGMNLLRVYLGDKSYGPWVTMKFFNSYKRDDVVLWSWAQTNTAVVDVIPATYLDMKYFDPISWARKVSARTTRFQHFSDICHESCWSCTWNRGLRFIFFMSAEPRKVQQIFISIWTCRKRNLGYTCVDLVTEKNCKP